MLVLLSSVLEQEPRKPIGEWLILDKAHAIKNHKSQTYHSIPAPREHFNACLIMTDTPLNNKLQDGYALLRTLKSHTLPTFLLFQAASLRSLSSGPSYPEGYHKARHIQLLDATSLQQPQTALKQTFPELHRTLIVKFPLDPEDPRLSNKAFKMFKKSIRPGSRGGKHAG
jgi:SNF2 family DNA or RNA helicase